MVELLRTNDLVKLSWAQALLDEAGIAHVVLDQHASVLDGSIGILPRRLMIDADDLAPATELLRRQAAELDLNDGAA